MSCMQGLSAILQLSDALAEGQRLKLIRESTRSADELKDLMTFAASLRTPQAPVPPVPSVPVQSSLLATPAPRLSQQTPAFPHQTPEFPANPVAQAGNSVAVRLPADSTAPRQSLLPSARYSTPTTEAPSSSVPYGSSYLTSSVLNLNQCECGDVFEEPTSHMCDLCTRQMHAFHGIAASEEGFGQKRRCKWCVAVHGQPHFE